MGIVDNICFLFQSHCRKLNRFSAGSPATFFHTIQFLRRWTLLTPVTVGKCTSLEDKERHLVRIQDYICHTIINNYCIKPDLNPLLRTHYNHKHHKLGVSGHSVWGIQVQDLKYCFRGITKSSMNNTCTILKTVISKHIVGLVSVSIAWWRWRGGRWLRTVAAGWNNSGWTVETCIDGLRILLE